MWNRALLCTAGILIGLSPVIGSVSQPRILSFEERVEAQRTIERVYYAHQTGASRPFDQAVPDEVLERKVQLYLKLSVALERVWSRPVTSGALEKEQNRITRATRSPERLREINDALGWDPLLIQETFVRSTLVHRTIASLFPFDRRIHAQARSEAEQLRADLIDGSINVYDPHPRRRLVEISQDGGQSAASAAMRAEPHDVNRVDLTPEDYSSLRERAPAAPLAIGPVAETEEAFVIQVVLEEDARCARIAAYSFPKTTWDEWWAENASRFDASLSWTVSDAELSPFTIRIENRPEAGVVTCPQPDTWAPVSVPDARRGHISIWTGTHMLIWGGYAPKNLFNSGARYDPATDSWTSMSLVNAPEPRRDHTAVWTGDRLIIWGGWSTGGHTTFFGSGGVYDPLEDKWTPTSTVNSPEARRSHTAVWTGQMMIVWGGHAYLRDVDTGGIYDLATDTWSPISAVGAPIPRTSHTAVWTGRLMVVWGGVSSGAWLGTGGRYDPATDTWTPTSFANAPSGRYGHTAVWTDSLMVVWGGYGGGYLIGGSRYDPASDTWTSSSTVNVPIGRYFHTAVWTGQEMIVWGGTDGGIATLSTGARYDPLADTWTPTSATDAPSGRYGHTAVWTGQEMIVWGGTDGGIATLSTGARYDPLADTWTRTINNPPPYRAYHTAAWTGSHLIIWGGNGAAFAPVASGGRYDPVTDVWLPTSTSGSPSARFGHSAVWTGERMIIWGGKGDALSLSTGASYDPIADEWTSTAIAGAPPRHGHVAVWTGQEMIIWGGLVTTLDTVEFEDSGARYTPSTDSWRSMTRTEAPAARSGCLAVWTGHEMIVWGGTESTYFNSGGRYDPSSDTWRPTTQVGAPAPRIAFTAVWTGREMVTWGGFAGPPPLTYFDTGGRYDPFTDTWQPTSVNGAPVARQRHSAVWTGKEIIVWGGENNDFGFFESGGRYEPASNTWTPMSELGAPVGRLGHSAVWTGEMMIVWGGIRYNTVLDTGGRYSLGPVDVDDDGFATCDGDCNNSDPSVYPGAPQICDTKNNDCGDPSWPALAGTNEADVDGDTYSVCQGDCNEGDPAVHPDALELCNGHDDDCDGEILAVEADADGDGFRGCEDDCNDSDPAMHPGAVELPGNRVDEDCDGAIACNPGVSWRNHGRFVRCVQEECVALVRSGNVSQKECAALVDEAARSRVGTARGRGQPAGPVEP